MTYSVMGINNYYMGGYHSRPSCCRGYNPFSYSMFSNPLYNPFTMVDTAKNLISGNWGSAFNYYSPMNYGYGGGYGYNSLSNFMNQVDYSLYNNPGNFDRQSGWGDYYQQNFNNTMNYMKNFDDVNTNSNPYNQYNSYTQNPAIARMTKPPSTFSNNYPAKVNNYTKFNQNHLNAEFLNKVKSVAKNINCDYEDLLAVMNSESGLNPQKWNGTGAVGLIQFTDIALEQIKQVYGISLTKNDVSKLSAMQQLDLAEKFYKDAAKKFKGQKLSAADLYALTYVPSLAKREILTRKGDGNYEGNEGLDENKDGVITKTDLNIHLAKKRVNLSTFA